MRVVSEVWGTFSCHLCVGFDVSATVGDLEVLAFKLYI